MPVLFVLLPLALILRTIQVAVGTETVRLVVLPLAVVNVTVGVDEATVAIGLVVGPVALVHGPVLPVLHALALPYLTAAEPLALVLRLVLQIRARSELALAQLLLVL